MGTWSLSVCMLVCALVCLPGALLSLMWNVFSRFALCATEERGGGSSISLSLKRFALKWVAVNSCFDKGKKVIVLHDH